MTDYRGKIIFDMDGVITGEGCYWNAAALTVWELLYSSRYLGLPGGGGPKFKTVLTPMEINHIRRIVFQGEKVITFFKQKAVNSNWDLAFLSFAYQLMLILKELSSRQKSTGQICQAAEKGVALEHLPLFSPFLSSPENPWTPSFGSVLGEWAGDARGRGLMEKLSSPFSGKYLEIARKTFTSFSPLWEGVRDIFQEWYLGDKKYKNLYGREPRSPGKKGLIENEEPLLDVDKIRGTLNQLCKKGWILGIATGRPFSEIYFPLSKMGIWNCFDAGSIVTYDDVREAEEELRARHSKNVSLGKPHPFSFLKSYWGKRYSNSRLLLYNGLRPKKGKCWVVGDSLADLLAAREMGVFFIGVLTGHSHTDSSGLFKREGARAVLADMTKIPHFFEVSCIDA